jgi:glycosyltransferase involved in cell wall biosynthesis
MRVIVTTVQVPFIRGGGELHVEGLVNALRAHGANVEMVSMPFRFCPAESVQHAMQAWEDEDFEKLPCGRVDKVSCLKFPTFYLQHPRKIVWLMHQHRAVYELFNTPYGENDGKPEAVMLRNEIIARDTRSLAHTTVYANSRRVAERLALYNGVRAAPLYHPPRGADRFFEGDQLPYIFAPSRLESLKRHELLLRALPHVDRSIMVLLVGEGGVRRHLEQLVAELNLSSRVKFLGFVDFDDMVHLYANALGVFFGPFDEDYGYVTLEAMLSSKPVITCVDSGGPLEFVIDGETGYVVDASPEAIAASVNALAADGEHARKLGRNGRARLDSLDISWERVVETLLETTAR